MSKVYFSDSGTKEVMINNLEKLYEKIPKDLKGKKVGIKIHFGEKGNTTHLNPEYAKKICELVEKDGEKRELIKCNTL